MNATPGGALSKLQLAQFVEAHFFPPGQDLESWIPPDWTDRYSYTWKGCGDMFPALGDGTILPLAVYEFSTRITFQEHTDHLSRWPLAPDPILLWRVGF